MGARKYQSSTKILEGDEFIARRVAQSIVVAANPAPPRIIAAPAR